MNYLAKNLNNSSVLSYDIMKIIYEYTDPLIDIRKQIENKDLFFIFTYINGLYYLYTFL